MVNSHAHRVSALSNHFESGHFGISDQTGVIVVEMTDFDLLQIAAWPQTYRQVASVASQSIGAGAKNSRQSGQSIHTDQGILLRVEPLKWWLLTSQRERLSNLDIESSQGSLLDLSHSRTWLKLKGDKATTLLNHFLPIDFRSAVFPAGSVISTAFHHIGITLYYNNDEFNIFLPRSFALSLWELLFEGSMQYGLEVNPGQTFDSGFVD